MNSDYTVDKKTLIVDRTHPVLACGKLGLQKKKDVQLNVNEVFFSKAESERKILISNGGSDEFREF